MSSLSKFRKGHGTGKAALARTELALKDGYKAVPDAEAGQPDRLDRDAAGRFASKEAAREAGRRGGLARAAADPKKWSRGLGLASLLTHFKDFDGLAPYKRDAVAWLEAEAMAVARDVGGGELAPGCMSVLETAARQRMFSKFYFDLATTSSFAWQKAPAGTTPSVQPRSDLVGTASRLANDSRQNVAAARIIAAEDARGRAQRLGPVDPQDALRASLGFSGDGTTDTDTNNEGGG